MTNITNLSTSCIVSDYVLKIVDNYDYISNMGLLPIYFLVGLAGHGLALVIFWKQSKEKGAYAYQIICCVANMLEILSKAYQVLFLTHLSGFRIKPGNYVFKQSYVLMWMTALATLPAGTFISMSLFSSLSMALDRLFAMLKPHLHKKLRHRRHQIASIAVCFLISFSTSAFDSYRYQVITMDDHYEIQINQPFVNSIAALIWNYIRISIRMAGLIALIGCNVAMVVIFRKRVVKTVAINGNEKQIADRKAKERTLVKLAVCQSFFTGVGIGGGLVYHIILYVFTSQANCVDKVASSVSDFLLQICGIMEFFGFMIISKRFRDSVCKWVKCRKVETKVSTQNISTNHVMSTVAPVSNGMVGLNNG